MPTTIKDIAKRLNVSVSTVSYALNDGPRPVAPEVKARILAVAEELDYRPNRLARSLVTRRTFTVGFVPNQASHDIMLSPFVQQFLNSVINELEDCGHDLVIFTAARGGHSQPRLDRILDGRVDGVIFLSPNADDPVLDALDRREFPYVTVAMGGAKGRTDFSIDNRRGMEILMVFLQALGHKKFGLISGRRDHHDSSEREEEFFRFIRRNELDCRPEWQYRGDFTYGGGDDGAVKIVSQPSRPSVIVCANDESAAGALNALRSFGLKVPDDISLTGFDDLSMSVRLNPPLTTVRQPIVEMGTAAVASLMQIMTGGQAESQQFEPLLIRRGSAACPPEDNHS